MAPGRQNRVRMTRNRTGIAAGLLSLAMIELRHLRYFLAVADELKFGRAAVRLHMAQPPLSVAIRQFEAEVGTELFARSSREVRLTPAGEVFRARATETLEALERALSATRRAGDGELGMLRIAFS